ncbi:hypothetical protein BDW75DRAFT_221789 [Aspergillus navahoensis]
MRLPRGSLLSRSGVGALRMVQTVNLKARSYCWGFCSRPRARALYISARCHQFFEPFTRSAHLLVFLGCSGQTVKHRPHFFFSKFVGQAVEGCK